MKLKEYFHHQKHTFLTDNEKFFLYQKIVAQRDIKKSFLQRYAFAKKIAYASFVLLSVFAVYWVHFFRDDIRYMTNSLIVQNAGDAVQASYIAQVVHFNGRFFIEHNGKPLQTSAIRDGDTVTLRAETELVFHIDEQTKAKLVWPAKFILSSHKDIADSYTIELIYGDFVEIQSLKDMTTQDIVLVSNDITVRQEKAEKASHFQLLAQWDSQRVENKGAKISVIHQKEDAGLETSLESRQTLTLAPNDITLIDNETQITTVLVQRDVSQTVAFVDVEDKVEKEDELSLDVLSSVFKTEEVQVDEDIVSEVDALTDTKDKIVITPEQNNALRGSLYKDFLLNDMQVLLQGYVDGDEAITQRSIASLQTKIVDIYISFWLTVPQRQNETKEFSHTIQMIKQLVPQIETNYYIPPRYIHNIDMIVQSLEYIQKQEFWKQENKPSLPSNLRFQ